MLAGGAVSVFFAYFQQYCENWFGMTEQTQSWLNNSYLCFGYGLIAGVVIIFLYNRVQDNIREQELIKRRRIALRLLRQPLYRLLGALAAMHKATDKHYDMPVDIPIHDLFDENYFKNAIHLDFGKLLYPQYPTLNHFTWFRSFSERVDRLTSVADKVIWKYSDYLETDMVDLLEKLNDSFFAEWAKGLPNSFKRYDEIGLKIPGYYPGRMDGAVPEAFQEFVGNFLTVINNYNCWVDTDKKIKFNSKIASVDLGSALLDQEQLEYQSKSIRESLIARGKIKEG